MLINNSDDDSNVVILCENTSLLLQARPCDDFAESGQT
jgi:hypothetical protein